MNWEAKAETEESLGLVGEVEVRLEGIFEELRALMVGWKIKS